MSLQVWLPLNEDIHNQGLMNISFTNSNAAINNNGKIGKCYYFDISENSMIKNNNDIPTNNWSQGSLCCWVKLNTFPNDSTNPKWAPMLFLGTSGLYANSIFGLVFEYSNYINISIHGSTTGKNAYKHNLITDTWYHICTTYDGSIVKLYINGQEVMSKTATLGTFNSDLSTLYVGGNPSYILNGYLNDCRYYDHCLSAKEVEEISKGLVLHYKLDNNGLGNPNLLLDTNAPSLTKVNADYNRYIESSSSGTYTITWETIPDPPAPGIINGVRESVSAVSSFHSVVWYNGSLVNVVVGNTYTMSCYVKIISGSDLLFTFQYGKSPYVADTQTLINDHEWHQYSWTFVPNDSAAANGTTRIYPGGLKAIGEVLICGWKLEEGDQATPWCLHDDEMPFNLRDKVCDCSGYNNTGTYSSGTFKAEINSPRYILAHKFPRNLIHSAIWTNDNYLEEFTISFWLKSWDDTATTSSGLIYYGVVSCYIGAATGSYPNRLMFGWYQGKSDVNTYSSNAWATAIVVPKDLWQYYTITFNKGLLKCYTNGEYVNQSDRTNTGNSIRANYASSNQVGNSLRAYLSDLRIYATALTENQIKELYNTSMSIDNNGNIYSRELVE